MSTSDRHLDTNQPDHFDESLLLAYIEGDATREQNQAVSELLANDPKLARLLSEMKADRMALMAMPVQAPPPGMVDDALAGMERHLLLGDPNENIQTTSQPANRLRFVGRTTGYLAAAAALGLCATVLFSVLKTPNSLDDDSDFFNQMAKLSQPEETNQTNTGDTTDASAIDPSSNTPLTDSSVNPANLVNPADQDASELASESSTSSGDSTTIATDSPSESGWSTPFGHNQSNPVSDAIASATKSTAANTITETTATSPQHIQQASPVAIASADQPPAQPSIQASPTPSYDGSFIQVSNLLTAPMRSAIQKHQDQQHQAQQLSTKPGSWLLGTADTPNTNHAIKKSDTESTFKSQNKKADPISASTPLKRELTVIATDWAQAQQIVLNWVGQQGVSLSVLPINAQSPNKAAKATQDVFVQIRLSIPWSKELDVESLKRQLRQTGAEVRTVHTIRSIQTAGTKTATSNTETFNAETFNPTTSQSAESNRTLKANAAATTPNNPSAQTSAPSWVFKTKPTTTPAQTTTQQQTPPTTQQPTLQITIGSPAVTGYKSSTTTTPAPTSTATKTPKKQANSDSITSPTHNAPTAPFE